MNLPDMAQRAGTSVLAFLADNRDPVVFAAAVVALVLLLVVGWRFWRTGNRSKKIANLAAAVVMVWTSEGLWNVAVNRFSLPAQFAAISFFVFELLLLAAALRAEEERAEYGRPGAAGGYAFVIGGTSGVVSSFGAHNAGEVVFRIILPMVALGLWWVLLVARRPTDTPEMLAERQRRADERDAGWVWTPNKVLVALGVKKPGAESVTEAQRRHQIRRMVAAADTIALDGRGSKRAAMRLRRLTRTATDDMVAEVARQQRKAALAVSLMVTRDSDDKPAVDLQEHADVDATDGDTSDDSLSPDDATVDATVVADDSDNPTTDVATDGDSDSDTGATDDATPGRHDSDTADDRRATLTRQPRRQVTRQADRKNKTDDGVKKILAADPGATPAEIAKRLKVSVRTAQRYMPKEPEHGPVNGRVPELESL